jgi:hypothetical protein
LTSAFLGLKVAGIVYGSALASLALRIP